MKDWSALAAVVAALSLATPTLLVHYPPMSDLPLHEAVVGALGSLRDPVRNPGLYELNLGHPNQLFFLVAWALAHFVPVATACKLTVAASSAGIVLGASRLAAHVGAPRWAALLVAPVALGWLYFWGLVANMAGLALFLALLPSLDELCARPTLRALPVVGAIHALLFLTHESTSIAACTFMVYWAALAPWSLRDTALRIVPPALVLVLAVLELLRLGRNTVTAAVPDAWGDWLQRLIIVPGLLSAGYEPWVALLVFGLAVFALALLVLPRLRPGRAPTPGSGSWRQTLIEHRFAGLAGLLLAAYLGFPTTLHGATLVHHRFLPAAWAVGVLALARRRADDAPLPRLAPLACAAVPAAALVVSVPVFLDADRTFRDLDEVASALEEGQAVMCIELGPPTPHRLFHPQTAAGHLVALKGGRSFFDYTLSHISPAYLKPRHHQRYTYARLVKAPYLFAPEYDFKRFRYVLIHTRDPARGAASAVALRPEGKLAARKGEWYLFEATSGVLPVDAPDEPLEDKRTLTLHARLIVSLMELAGRNADEVLRANGLDGGP